MKRHLWTGNGIARLVRDSGPKLSRDYSDAKLVRTLALRELQLDLLTTLDLEGDPTHEGVKHLASVLCLHAEVVIDLLKAQCRYGGTSDVNEINFSQPIVSNLTAMSRPQARDLTLLLALLHRAWVTERKIDRGLPVESTISELTSTSRGGQDVLPMPDLAKTIRNGRSLKTHRLSRPDVIRLHEIQTQPEPEEEEDDPDATHRRSSTHRASRMSSVKTGISKLSSAATKARERLANGAWTHLPSLGSACHIREVSPLDETPLITR